MSCISSSTYSERCIIVSEAKTRWDLNDCWDFNGFVDFLKSIGRAFGRTLIACEVVYKIVRISTGKLKTFGSILRYMECGREAISIQKGA